MRRKREEERRRSTPRPAEAAHQEQDGQQIDIQRMLNAPNVISSAEVLRLQRSLGNQRVDRLIARRARSAIQRKPGDANDPHRVFEKSYHILAADALDESVLIPKVSGCAAVKITLYANDQVSASIAFHSDGTADSHEAARRIGQDIAAAPGAEKRVTILAVTNGHEFQSLPEHTAVLANLYSVLKQHSIPYTFDHQRLIRQTQDRIDIDLTGSEAQVHARYEAQTGFSEEERFRKQEYYKLYKLYEAEARELNIFKARLKQGRKEYNNPHYIKHIAPGDWAKLEPDAAGEAVQALRTKIDAAKASGCFITTACMRSRGLPDDCEELTLLRAYRDGYMAQLEDGPALLRQYYSAAPAIVAAIDARRNASAIYDELYGVIQLCVEGIKQGRHAEVLAIYSAMVYQLHAQYGPATASRTVRHQKAGAGRRRSGRR